MIAFLDTSAVVKLLVKERGSDEVRALASEAQGIVLGALTEVESAAALERGRRGGAVSARDYGLGRDRFEILWRRAGKVPVDSELLLRAVHAVQRHGLRGFDAVQLACAESVSNLEPVVVCFDRELHAAARKDGFAVRPNALA